MERLQSARSRPQRPAWPASFPDINECLQLPRTCAYQCHNLQGSYRCLCPPGQTLLRDGKTCTPLEHNVQNVTTVSHRGPLVPWLRPRAPIPGVSYHAWVSLRPGPRALSVVRAWCPPGFIRQNGICTGKTEPQQGHTLLRSLAPRLRCGHHAHIQKPRAPSKRGRQCFLATLCLEALTALNVQGLPKRMEYFPNHLTSGHFTPGEGKCSQEPTLRNTPLRAQRRSSQGRKEITPG